MSDSDQKNPPAPPLADAHASRPWTWAYLTPEHRARLEAASRAPETIEPGALPDARNGRPWAQGFTR